MFSLIPKTLKTLLNYVVRDAKDHEYESINSLHREQLQESDGSGFFTII